MWGKRRYLWECIKFAWRGSISLANALAPLLGAAAIWLVLWLLGFEMIVPDRIPGLIFVAIFCIGAAWLILFFIRLLFLAPYALHRQAQKNTIEAQAIHKTLKRMIAYGRLDLIVPWNGKAPQFHGYNIGVQNVSDDTITAWVMFLNADVDGTKIMASPESSPTIIPQTQGIIFQSRRTPEDDAPISMDAKAITVEFEVDYNTIPETGVRRSYRKMTYPLDWANGKNSAPLLQPQTVDEWEK